jgi:hypothetical protein
VRQAVFLLALLFLCCGFAFAQNNTGPRSVGPRTADPQFGQRRGADQLSREMERERTKQQAKERQAAIKRDTEKLLALATQLKEYVDKSNENVLSVDVVRKAEEIEKLAHHVKEKMRD